MILKEDGAEIGEEDSEVIGETETIESDEVTDLEDLFLIGIIS